MSSFTGRRPTGNAARFGKGLLDGLTALGTALSDGPKYARIDEIDQQIEDLLQERDHLIADLIEPGTYTVSENYDPNWRKPAAKTFVTEDGFSRLVECEGREYSGTYHKAHPACPYINKIHNAHEFTLRD